MRYMTSHFSVAGKVRPINEDSLCYRQAFFSGREIIMATICDGMGGLSRGEFASSHVIKSFYEWFENRLPIIMEKEIYLKQGFNQEVVINEWKRLIGNENKELHEQGKVSGHQLGTTLSVILIIEGQYVIGHVGDSRIYHITWKSKRLTKDQSLVAEELREGLISRRDARKDKRINVLLECIGASEMVHPLFFTGHIKRGKILLCTDGFWHKPCEVLFPFLLMNLNPMNMKESRVRKLRKIVMCNERKGEEDNASVILIDIEK